MATSSKAALPGRWGQLSGWAHRAPVLAAAGLGALVLGGVVLASAGHPGGAVVPGSGGGAEGDGTDAVAELLAAIVASPMDGPSVLARVALLAGTSVLAGLALTRPLLGREPVAGRVRLVGWIAVAVTAAASVAAVTVGGASRPWAVAQLVLALLVPMLLTARRPDPSVGSEGSGAAASVAVGPDASTAPDPEDAAGTAPEPAGTAGSGPAGPRSAAALPGLLVGLALAGLLAAELAAARSGLAWWLDAGYALTVALLVGVSVLGAGRVESAATASGLRSAALASGLLASVLGLGQLLLTGPRTGVDAHSAYGIGAAAQAGLPVLATVVWALLARPAGRARAAELSGFAALGLVAAVLAGAALATLPRPAPAPVPGQPLLRPVDLGMRRLAVQVTPMRPGPNLVHVGPDPAVAGSGEMSGDMSGDMSGGMGGAGTAPAAAPAAGTPAGMPGMAGMQHRMADGPLAVASAGPPVPLTARPGAAGLWAVVDIPAGATRLVVTQGGGTAGDAATEAGVVPVDVGTADIVPGTQRTLAGPDGPECASAALGALVGGRATPSTCPADGLAPSDARALSDSVEFLAGRGITALNLVADDSARGRAAADLVRAEAARHRLAVAGTPTAGDTLLVVSGWVGAKQALDASTRRGGQAGGGVLLAPWLLTGPVVTAASSEVLPLSFNPQETTPRRYGAFVAAVFPGEGPSASGYLAWRGGRDGLEARPTFYGAAPVDVPMGMPMPLGGGPSDWYPSGTVVPINPPLGGGTP